MKTFAICLLALVLCANGTSLFDQYPINFSPKRSIMTLLTQIEAKMKTGGPLDAITKMLKDFETQIQEEQITHDALFERQQKECKEEKEFREKEVRDADAALKEAKETFDGCTAQQQRAIADSAITKRQLNENREFMIVIEDQRKRDRQAYEAASQKYEFLVAAIDECMIILEGLISGENVFAQLAQGTNKMLKAAVAVRKAHLFAGLMQALAQLASKDPMADQAIFEQVKNLFIGLKQKSQEEFNEASQGEDLSRTTYEEDHARLTTTISTLEDQSNQLEIEITELDKCIINQIGILASAEQKKGRNAKLLEDSNNLCGSVEQEYETAKKDRTLELKLLAAIRERVEARFAQMSEGVKSRGTQDEFSMTNEADYEHKQFKASF